MITRFGAFHHRERLHKHTELAVRERNMKTASWRPSRWAISILLTPPRRLLPSPSRVPRSGEGPDFRSAGDPPSEFRSTFTRLSAGSDRDPRLDTDVSRVARGRVGPLRRGGREPVGIRAAASFMERAATPGWPRLARDVPTARPATLKPVLWTAPWRP